jgi:hypothetical protein
MTPWAARRTGAAASGVAAGRGPHERSRAGALRGDRGALERRTDARLVTGHRHRVEGRLSLARRLLRGLLAGEAGRSRGRRHALAGVPHEP